MNIHPRFPLRNACHRVAGLKEVKPAAVAILWLGGRAGTGSNVMKEKEGGI